MTDEERESSGEREVASEEAIGEETVGEWLDTDPGNESRPPEGDLPDEPPPEAARSSGGLWHRLRRALGGH